MRLRHTPQSPEEVAPPVPAHNVGCQGRSVSYQEPNRVRGEIDVMPRRFPPRIG
jgi:hypothetical protein